MYICITLEVAKSFMVGRPLLRSFPANIAIEGRDLRIPQDCQEHFVNQLECVFCGRRHCQAGCHSWAREWRAQISHGGETGSDLVLRPVGVAASAHS